MARKLAVFASILLCIGLIPAVAVAKPEFTPGAPGAGDPYYPLDGNGGYQVIHYLLDVRYQPATDFLSGVATIRSRATQNLSRFNLDLHGLTVRSIAVDRHPATWVRDGDELVITPPKGIRDHTGFETVIRYDGVPETLDEFGVSGFIHTDDGALVAGEPHVADTWFPVNDHPSDTAAYTLLITVPKDLEAVANGVLLGTRTRDEWTTWTWQASEPMASYLVGMGIGHFDLHGYRQGGLRYWDAIDTVLFEPPASPHTGEQFAISQKADLSYKRLSHTIDVPPEGGGMSFWVTRDTEPSWDHFFVEAHTVGADDWTTLPDVNGHTGQDTGNSCPFWLDIHPFLRHYQTPVPDPGEDEPPCLPSGSTGDWWAATGASDGWEQWSVDLTPWAARTVEVALTYASDDIVQLFGAFVDDIDVSTGQGTTSFEADGDPMDGWTVPGPPEGSPGNENDWIVGTEADAPPSRGQNAEGSLARQGEIISFEGGNFGRYPFRAAGGIVDDADLFFALENQTRPIYSKYFFTDPGGGDFVVVHELAHQWYGDSLTVAAWRHIWLNEGFATYAEWLWSEHEGFETPQEIFDLLYEAIPADDPFWSIIVGDPGTEALFDFAIYARGAMTLQQLRRTVGDRDFFRILKRWAQSMAGENVSTNQFIRLAERVSGQQLDELFRVWLFTPEKPDLDGSVRPGDSSRIGLSRVPSAIGSLIQRLRATSRGSPWQLKSP